MSKTIQFICQQRIYPIVSSRTGYPTRRCLVGPLPGIEGFYWFQEQCWLWACRNWIIWQTNPYFLLSAAYLMCFFRIFSSFDLGKQGSSIAKNKVPLVTILMLSNQEESKLPSTTFTLTMLLSYEFTFAYRKLTLSVLYIHFKGFLQFLINLVRLLRDVSRYAQVCLKYKLN